MNFARPMALWLLLLVPALATLGWAARTARRRRLRRFASEAILPRLLVGGSWVREAAMTSLRLGAIGLVTVALARPQWGRRDEPVVRRGVDVVLALDLSASMLAEDVSPNRFEEARAEAASLLGSLTGDRVGLVVFGGRAAAPCPLTLDYGAVRLFLDAAEPDFVPSPGSDLGSAIEEASKLFNASERGYKTVVLLTDGEDLEGRGAAAAAEARKNGVIVHAIGVGTVAGGPIPLRDDQGALTGYKKDREGKVVTTRLDAGALEKIAVAGDGSFLHAGPAGEEGRRIADAIGKMEKREIASRLATRFEDRYQIPLAVALVLLALESLWIGRKARRVATREDVPGSGAGAEAPRRSGAVAALTVAAAVLLAGSGAGIARADDPPAGEDDPGAKEPPSSQGWPGDAGTPPAKSAGTRPAPAGPGRAEPAPREEQKAPPAAARRNREANRLYGRKDYGQALSKYEEASAAAPDLPSLRYNIGNALYREGKYDAAAAEYSRALSKAGKSLAPAARYNLGNAHFQQQQYTEAVDAYRRVLEERPGDEAARHNLELALRALRQKEQEQKQSQKDWTKPPDPRQKSPRSQPSPGDQKPKDEPRPQDQKQPGDQKPPTGPQDSQGKSSATGAAEGKIGKKEAEKLLDSLAQEEKRDLRKRLARLPQEQGPEKDW
jgi:Ca-activated chloride channel family protein